MKRCFFILIAVMLAVLSVGIYANEPVWEVGEVLYHQDFSDIGEFESSGIRVGTLSSESEYGCRGEYFTVTTKDSGRVYMILPEFSRGNTFTVEFSTKFTDNSNSRGYVGFMLTCRGDEPTNITYVVIRSDGTIDDFSQVPKELSSAIAAGEEIYVTIPVENNILHYITVKCGTDTYTLERDSLLLINEGDMGLMYRRAGVGVKEIYIVNGVGYTEKTGRYADESYAGDDKPVIEPDEDNGGGGAPVTSDMGFAVPIAAMTLSLGAIGLIWGTSFRKRSNK